jgi:hypothetical protein
LPGIDHGVRLAGSPHAGTLFVQGSVTVDGRRARFDDHAGTGWRLVALPGVSGALGADLVAWFARIGGRLVTVGEDGGVGDPDDVYGTWFARHGTVAALQRPDFHLYGTARDADEVVDLLARLRATLGAPAAGPPLPTPASAGPADAPPTATPTIGGGTERPARP